MSTESFSKKLLFFYKQGRKKKQNNNLTLVLVFSFMKDRAMAGYAILGEPEKHLRNYPRKLANKTVV